MNKTILDCLYSAHTNGEFAELGIKQPLMFTPEADKLILEFTKGHCLNVAEEDELFDIAMAVDSAADRAGFMNGLRLGLMICHGGFCNRLQNKDEGSAT